MREGRIRTSIVDPDPQARKLMERIVQEEPLLMHVGSQAEFTPEAVRSRDGQQNQLVLLYETQAMQNAHLPKTNPLTHFVVVGPKWPMDYDHAVRQNNFLSTILSEGSGNVTRFGYVLGDRNYELNQKEFRAHTSSLIEQGKVVRKMRIGEIGMGKFGHNILREVIKDPWISLASVYSRYFDNMWGRQPLPFEKLASHAKGGNKVMGVRSIEDMVSTNPDIILITTGPYKADYNLPREEWTEKQFVPSALKIDSALSSLVRTGYDGLVGILSHPPGPFLSFAHRKYGMPSDKLVSFSSDTVRAQAELFYFLVKKLGLEGKEYEFQTESMPMDVFGEHGERAEIYWNMMFSGTDRLVSKLLIPDESEKKEIARRLREVGREIMTESEQSGINYFDVPEAVRDCLGMIAHYRKNMPFAWYSRIGQEVVSAVMKDDKDKKNQLYADSFLMLPVQLQYPDMTVGLSSDFNPRDMPKYMKDHLAECIKAQDYLVNKAMDASAQSRRLKVV